MSALRLNGVFLALAALVGATGCPSDSPGEDDFGFGPMSTGTQGGDDDDDDDDDGEETEGADGTGDSGTSDDDDDDDDDDGTDVEPEGPHARGTIILGETHEVGGSTSTPFVTATFSPDYQPPQMCGQMAASCFVGRAPECLTPCEVGEACVYSDACQPECQKVCDLPCGANEVCYFPAADSAPACKTVETFDAGPLAFEGTTAPLTLFPPYAFVGMPSGSFFLPGASLSLSAQGGGEAGFDAFDVDFTATTFVSSGLAAIDPTIAYDGMSNVPVTWTPGEQDARVLVTVTNTAGEAGTMDCVAVDSLGEFDIPRSALDAALGNSIMATMSVTIERSRTSYIGGLTTHGELTESEVQADGWLEVVTKSQETTTVQDCGTLAWCGGACVDTDTNVSHCGGCNMPCTDIQICSTGVCS